MCVCVCIIDKEYLICERACMWEVYEHWHAVCVHWGLCTCRIGTLQFNKFEETLVSAGLEVAPV